MLPVCVDAPVPKVWMEQGLWAYGCFACHLHKRLRKTKQNLGNQTKGDADAGWLGIWDGRDALALLCRVGGSEGSPSRHVRAWLWLWIPSWSRGMGLIPWGCCSSLLLGGTGRVCGDKSASDLHNWQKEPVS